MRKVWNIVLLCILTALLAGATIGCEDEVKVHRESETTTETQTMEVTQ